MGWGSQANGAVALLGGVSEKRGKGNGDRPFTYCITSSCPWQWVDDDDDDYDSVNPAYLIRSYF